MIWLVRQASHSTSTGFPELGQGGGGAEAAVGKPTRFLHTRRDGCRTRSCSISGSQPGSGLPLAQGASRAGPARSKAWCCLVRSARLTGGRSGGPHEAGCEEQHASTMWLVSTMGRGQGAAAGHCYHDSHRNPCMQIQKNTGWHRRIRSAAYPDFRHHCICMLHAGYCPKRNIYFVFLR